MIHAGIDAGSRALKVVLIDADTEDIVASAIEEQGVSQDELATATFDRLLNEAGAARDEVGAIVATGYGRGIVSFADTTITEITCHATGVRCLAADARTVIDIGGQDSKLIRLDDEGGVRDFAMNDRCAAGTGRFLEVVADRLEVRLDDLGSLARESKEPAAISSMCVVFAETEIVGLLASGARPADIVAGAQRSIATRVASMAGRRPDAPVVFTGGVAIVSGMLEALSEALDTNVRLAPRPQITGALGAALLAARL